MTTGLNELELEAIRLSADLMGVLAKVVGNGPTRGADLQEFATHIHGIQHAVMSQAAARAHPEIFRILGGTISPTPLDQAGEQAYERFVRFCTVPAAKP